MFHNESQQHWVLIDNLFHSILSNAVWMCLPLWWHQERWWCEPGRLCSRCHKRAYTPACLHTPRAADANTHTQGQQTCLFSRKGWKRVQLAVIIDEAAHTHTSLNKAERILLSRSFLLLGNVTPRGRSVQLNQSSTLRDELKLRWGEQHFTLCFCIQSWLLFTHARPHTHAYSYTLLHFNGKWISSDSAGFTAVSRGQSSSLQHNPDSSGIHIERYSKQTSKCPACSTFICSDCSCLKEGGRRLSPDRHVKKLLIFQHCGCPASQKWHLGELPKKCHILRQNQ